MDHAPAGDAGVAGDPAPDTPPSRRWRKRVLVGGAAVLAAVTVFVAVTAATGLPAAGPLHRYPYGELASLRDQVNADAGDIRTPDDCWRELSGDDGPLRDIAAVDLLRSRVVVRIYSGNVGEVDPWTYNAVVGRLDAIVRSDPDLRWGMIQIEASPDGWSPLVSCRLVTRGYRLER